MEGKKFKFMGILGLIFLMAIFLVSTSFGATPSTLKRNYWKAKQYFSHGIDVTGGELTVNGNVITGESQFSEVRYVHSGTGHDTLGNDYGLSWEKPWATIEYAIGQCTDNQGDVIYVLPGHAATLDEADEIDADVAGIYIIGLGTGADKPEFTYSGTAGEFVIGAANVTLANCRFIAGISAITMGISVEAAGDNAMIIDCDFLDSGNSTYEFLDAIDLASGANGVIIAYNTYDSETTTGEAHFIEMGNGVNEDTKIIGNQVRGNFSVSAIWSDDVDLNILVKDNMIANETTGQHAIEFADAATGFIVGNKCYGDTEGSIIDPGSMYLWGNDLSVAIDNEALPRWVINQDLNHLMETAAADTSDPVDMTAEVPDNTILANIMDDGGDTSAYDRRYDSLVALSDKIDTIDDNIDGASTLAGQTYANKVTMSSVTDTDLFDVDGGAILITSFVGVVTTNIENQACTLEINLDADSGFTDYDFSTAVDLDNDQAGQRIVFTSANESVLTPLAGADAGASILMTPWFCGEGMIEAATSATNTGVIDWYITWIPFEDGTTVTAQ